MRVGIVTFHRADNYGAVLQCMALVECLRDFSPEVNVQTLDYRCPFIERNYRRPFFRCSTHNPLVYLKRIGEKICHRKEIRSRWTAFDIFRRDYLYMTQAYSKEELLEGDLKFDLLITGSDQVWNSGIVGDRDDPVYSLDFARECKRVSYAASAGSSATVGGGTLRRLAGLHEISVRETELGAYLEQKLNRQVRVNVDPVFLLAPERWQTLLPKERIIEEPFVFAYCVSEDKKKEVSQIAQQIARKRGCKVLYIDYKENYGSCGECHFDAGPLDFVRFIRDAEMVVASSFHAAAFSAIFEKTFAVIPCQRTGVRMVELLKSLELSAHIVSDSESFNLRFQSIEQWPKAKTSDNLPLYRESSLAYLREMLNSATD